MNNHELKHAKVELQKMHQKRLEASANRQRAERELELATISIQKLEKQIASAKKKKEVIISEHAILRYLERVYQMDMLKIQLEIAPLDVRETIKMFGGNGTFETKTHRIIVVDSTITTVIKD